MISETTETFRRQVQDLPPTVRAAARETYRKWLSNPRHPSLQFKRIHRRDPIYSVRIGIHWRAACVVEGDTATWFWIGSHAAYDSMIRRMRQT